MPCLLIDSRHLVFCVFQSCCHFCQPQSPLNSLIYSVVTQSVKSDSKLKQNYSCRFGNSSSLCKEAFITSFLWQVYCYYYMKKNTCYSLFSCRCLSPLLGIYDINIFYSVFFHYLCLLRCGQVNEWTSRRVNKLLEKKTKEL
mgnify:FL=1